MPRPRLQETVFKVHPQIEKYAHYRDHIHKNFRWNGRTIFLSVVFGILVPYFIFSKVKQSQLRQYEYEGKGHIQLINPFDLIRAKPASEEEWRLERARRFKKQYELATQMDIEKKLSDEKSELEREAKVTLRPQGELETVRAM